MFLFVRIDWFVRTKKHYRQFTGEFASTDVSKRSKKYCVPYFLFEIVV